MRNVPTAKSEEKAISPPVPAMAKTILVFFAARPVIIGFLRTMAPSSCIPTLAKRIFSGSFWPLPNATVFGGQPESYPMIRMQ
jgi:hypothetical protein